MRLIFRIHNLNVGHEDTTAQVKDHGGVSSLDWQDVEIALPSRGPLTVAQLFQNIAASMCSLGGRST